ncbi:MAG: phosphotransferase, partial [Trebonia sp.]
MTASPRYPRLAGAGDREFLNVIAAETGLGVSAEPFPQQSVARLVAERYGLSGQLTRIPTEKDDTFALSTNTGKFLVKVSPPGESLDIVNLQTAAMLHIRDRAPGLPVQVPVAAADGAFECPVSAPGDAARALRVLTYLPGQLLSRAQPSARQVRSIGSMLARLSIALRDFAHPRQDRLLIWDLQRFHRLRPLLDYVEDEANAALAARIFDQFDDQVRPLLPALTRQVVHSDFSPYNLLVDDSTPGYVKGVIDFGDVVRTAVVFDVAVGMANLLGTGPGNPWAVPLQFLDGYLAVRAVERRELAVLAVSAQARLLLRALMAQWRAVEDPARRDYLLSHSEQDWARLARVQEDPDREATARIAALGDQHRPAPRDRAEDRAEGGQLRWPAHPNPARRLRPARPLRLPRRPWSTGSTRPARGTSRSGPASRSNGAKGYWARLTGCSTGHPWRSSAGRACTCMTRTGASTW